MPIYDYKCPTCGKSLELFQWMNARPPECCGKEMNRCYSVGNMRIKMGPPLWTQRMDDIHKAQSDRGERLRFVHPSEIGAN